MRIVTGTSGWSYPAWKGRFYPAALPATRFLAHYSARLAAVEVNATFYRTPQARILAAWGRQVPAGFLFALKAPRRITHRKRLEHVGEDVAHFVGVAAELGAALGPVLFQLPPTAKRDVARLRDLLAVLPEGVRTAFEFRHGSWLADDVLAVLTDAGAALCVADTEETTTPLLATGTFGYLRLRRRDYDREALARWLERIRAQPWTEAFVFFKHEDEARGTGYALALASEAAARSVRSGHVPAP
jgi:uncharacterized protein YecE (DUF72 family)